MSNICPCTLGNSVAGALFNLRNAKKLSQQEPEQTASATIVSRRVETVYSLTKSSSSWGYLVKFRMENGEEAELKTTEDTYKELKEGTTVRLTWQGDTVVGFTPEERSAKGCPTDCP